VSISIAPQRGGQAAGGVRTYVAWAGASGKADSGRGRDGQADGRWNHNYGERNMTIGLAPPNLPDVPTKRHVRWTRQAEGDGQQAGGRRRQAWPPAASPLCQAHPNNLGGWTGRRREGGR